MRRRGRIWPPGIRAQMALGYSIVIGTLILFSYIVFAIFMANVVFRDPTNAALTVQVNRVAAAISDRNGTIVLNTASGLFPPAALGSEAEAQPPFSAASLSAIQSSDVATNPIIRILDLRAVPVYASPAFANLLVPDTLGQDAVSGLKESRVFQARDGTPVEVLSVPLVQSKERFAVLQVGLVIPLSATTGAGRTTLIFAAILLPVLLLAGMFGSYWLAGRAFRPIRWVAQAARKIEGGDLHQRVPVPPANDDVRDLAITFNEMIARLESAFTQQRRFVADASHELRTPVAAIRGLTDVALAGAPDPAAYAEALRNVNAEAERLSRLITDLLALARADEHHLHLEHESVRLDLVAADVAASLEPLAEAQSITLACGELTPIAVAGDTTRLIQAVMTLVDNAIAYTNPGGRVTLTVTVAGRLAQLAVADTGIGINPQDLPHIFERFYRGDPARTRARGGSGLGLSLAQGIVRAHGGEITVQSSPGHGTTFTITLPSASPAP